MINEIIIIGGGPAGLSAAIYSARAGLSPLVFAGSPPGGQLILTSEVENYPGFESILGPELIEKMRRQAKKFGAKIVDENVAEVDFSKRPFKIYLADSVTRDASLLRGSAENTPQSASRRVSSLVTPAKFTDVQKQVSLLFSHKNIFLAKSVIIATGAKALWLGLESEARLRGKGVSACATCDGFFFRDKVVGVVGGGDTAMEEALTLTRFAKKIYIIHRRNEFRASKIMQERVFANPKIEVIFNAVVEEILGEKKVEGVKFKIKNLKLKILNLDGLFIAIGHKPDTEIFKGQIKLDEKGYIVTKQSMTSVPGVFAAGDCVDYKYRQAGVAVGQGIAAALEVERYLSS